MEMGLVLNAMVKVGITKLGCPPRRLPALAAGGQAPVVGVVVAAGFVIDH